MFLTLELSSISLNAFHKHICPSSAIIVQNEKRTISVNTNEEVECLFSKFIDINNGGERGGAICSLNAVSVQSCLFKNTSGGDGGAIACANILNIIQSTFDTNQALNTNGAIYAAGDRNFLTSKSVFQSCVAARFGCFSKYGNCDTKFEQSNITQCSTYSNIAGFEFGNDSPKIKEIFQFNTTTRNPNTGNSFWNCNEININRCIYAWLISLTEETQSSSVLRFDCENGAATISSCSFLYNFPGSGYEIFINRANNIIIESTCFTEPQNIIFNNNSVASVLDSVVFQSKCKEFLKLPELSSIGFEPEKKLDDNPSMKHASLFPKWISIRIVYTSLLIWIFLAVFGIFKCFNSTKNQRFKGE